MAKKRKSSRRHVQVSRGKMQVALAITLACLFYATFAATALGRFGLVPDSIIVYGGILLAALAASSLAIVAYFAHLALRQIYLLLNMIGVPVGIVWVGTAILLEVPLHWVVLDSFGIVTALVICWVFYRSKMARRFLEEQEMTVKRG